jgi:hypothetical protein
MPSGEQTLPSRTASTMADLDPKWIVRYWRAVEACLREVFGKSEELSESAALLLYHDSPLQIASILAGASDRELTEQELLAYDKLWNPNVKDRPSREQILQVHRLMPKAG